MEQRVENSDDNKETEKWSLSRDSREIINNIMTIK